MDIVTRQAAEDYMNSFEGTALPSTGIPANLITDVSYRMAVYTGRRDWGGSESRTEYYDGGSQFLLVNYWPVTSITSINDDISHVWADSTLLDSDAYRILTDTPVDSGIIFFEYAQTVGGVENLKVVYTGGYASQTAIPAPIQRAALMQIRYEMLRESGGRFATLPGSNAGMTDVDPVGMGIIPEARILLERFRRRRPFA
jgi:hypothetical protein